MDDATAGAMMWGVADPRVDESFDAVFAAHYAGVARTVSFIIADRAVAEEVAQDAFVKLLEKWDTVSQYDRPDLWVRRVAIRRAQRERHRGWRRPSVERAAAPLTVVDGPAPTPHDEVLRAVGTLAPKQRTIVVLFYYEDRPMDEIAEIVGCSVSTGWSQLHNARKRLASMLAEEVGDDVC